MKFTNRESLIIKYLQQYSSSVNELSDYCKVSSKSIKNDINSINNKIEDYDSKINIINNVVTFSSIYSSVHWQNIVKLNQSIDEADLIFLKLLIKNDYIPMVDFASEIFISKSKLEKIIATNPTLDKYLVKKRNAGIKVDVSNDQKMKLMITTLLPYVDDLNYLVTSRALIGQVIDSDITIERFKASIDVFNKYVDEIETISDSECKILILLILISDLVFKLDNETLEKYVFSYVSQEEASEKIKTIINNIARETLTDNMVDCDSKLFAGLVNHLVYAVSHRYPNTIENEMELRLKAEYSYAYNIASDMYSRLSIGLAVDLESYEVNYMTMYIQSLINTNKQSQKFKILIVCQYGLSVSHYIETWISNNVDLDIEITISSVLNFWNTVKNLSEVDLVITTIDNLEVSSDKLIKVDTIPLESELSQVGRKIINTNFHKQMNSFFSSNTIRQVGITDLNQIYQIITSDFHHANGKFIEAMKVRTEEGLSNVNGIIIMHSDGSLITENRLLIYKLQTPIDYNGDEIKMIFVFAFSTEFIEMFGSVIKQIYKVIYAQEYVNALYETTTDKQFMWILKNQIKGSTYK